MTLLGSGYNLELELSLCLTCNSRRLWQSWVAIKVFQLEFIALHCGMSSLRLVSFAYEPTGSIGFNNEVKQ